MELGFSTVRKKKNQEELLLLRGCRDSADSVGAFLPEGLDTKESACNAGDLDQTPGRSPGEGHGYPRQYSCLENSMDRGAWQAMVHEVAKSRTRLSD